MLFEIYQSTKCKRYQVINRLHSVRFNTYLALDESNQQVILKEVNSRIGNQDTQNSTTDVTNFKIRYPDNNNKTESEILNCSELFFHNADVKSSSSLDSDSELIGKMSKYSHPSIDEGLIERNDKLIKETFLLAGFNHAQIPKLIDYGVHKKNNFLVMEFIQGWHLLSAKQRLKLKPKEAEKFGVFSEESFNKYKIDFLSLLSVVNYVHEESFVHRDLKEANILNSNKGPVLIDFDIAAPIGFCPDKELILGTPIYIPPEEIESLPLCAASDVYSLGMILYLALVPNPGSFFEIQGYPAIVNKMKFKELSPKLRNDKVSPQLDMLVRKATAWKTQNRFSCCEELADALKKIN